MQFVTMVFLLVIVLVFDFSGLNLDSRLERLLYIPEKEDDDEDELPVAPKLVQDKDLLEHKDEFFVQRPNSALNAEASVDDARKILEQIYESERRR